MFCQKCGQSFPDGNRFCPNCGADSMTGAAPGAGATPGYGAAPGAGATPGYGAAPGYGATSSYTATPVGGYRKVPDRNILTAIILSIVTCGIYGIIWFISLTDDTNTAIGEQGTSGGMAFLYSLITCGIYSWYWTYKQGEKLDRLAVMKGQAPSSRGILYLVLSICGLSIVAYALMQDSLNKLG